MLCLVVVHTGKSLITGNLPERDVLLDFLDVEPEVGSDPLQPTGLITACAPEADPASDQVEDLAHET